MDSNISINIKNFDAIPRRLSDSTKIVDEKLERFFLGDRALSDRRVIDLLVSSSFGTNSILYAVWLGYLMGMWAIIIHIAWCLSFCLIAQFGSQIYRFTSIHDFLNSCYGKAAKIISAICSIVGLLYFSGWEIAISKSGLESLGFFSSTNSTIFWSTMISIAICIALFYTAIGGQLVNGVVNSILNIIKMSLLSLIVVAVFYVVKNSHQSVLHILLPNISTAIMGIGIMGFITNLLLNLSWQFVDNSSWQIISSGKNSYAKGISSTLSRTSLYVFFVYFLETLLGASLRVIGGLNSDNILGGVTYLLGNYGGKVFAFAVVMLLLSSMMSLIDGVALSTAQTLVVDLGMSNISLKNKKTNLHVARVVTVVIGIIAAWGIQIALNSVGRSIFDFVYIFTVVQLSLAGPILIGLTLKPKFIPLMWLSIVIALIMGLGLSFFGGIYGAAWIMDASGFITLCTSLLSSIIIYFLNKNPKMSIHE